MSPMTKAVEINGRMRVAEAKALAVLADGPIGKDFLVRVIHKDWDAAWCAVCNLVANAKAHEYRGVITLS